MWVSKVHLRNIKGFADSGTIELSKGINVLLGANNAGKSILIKALFILQDARAIQLTDLRIGQNEGSMLIDLEDIPDGYVFPSIDINKLVSGTTGKFDFKINYANTNVNNPQIQGNLDFGGSIVQSIAGGGGPIGNVEPYNFIYPFLSKRKAISYSEQVNRVNATLVSPNLINIVSKIDRIANPQHPAYEAYKSACESIMGFFVSTFQTVNGKQAGMLINNFDGIPLEAMGEGVANLVGIIVDLCLAENKLFLIEELENDIHPKALKQLLEVIIQKSQTNQFVISTHSNIVTKYLGSVPESKLYYVTWELQNRVPTSQLIEVGNSPDERRKALEDLGYELIDYDLAKAWLILEESSAESIIREHLIPWFAPGLVGKVRTIASQGTSDVEPKFNDFNRLFLFLHLERIYRNCAWVIADGDPSGLAVISRLKQKYTPSGWAGEHFRNLSKSNFEEYYPSRFNDEVSKALATHEREAKQAAKKQLLENVLAWIAGEEQQAKAEFATSADEIITMLKEIEAIICRVVTTQIR